MALNEFTQKIRSPSMAVALLEPGTIDIEELIDSGTITLNTNSRSALWEINMDDDFEVADGFHFKNKRLRSITLPKQGASTMRQPYIGYDKYGYQQFDIEYSEDPDTNISFQVRWDGSEFEQIYPAVTGTSEIRVSDLKVGELPLVKDVLILIDGSLGNPGGKKMAHFFKNVHLNFTPEEGSADTKETVKGTFNGPAERYYMQRES